MNFVKDQAFAGNGTTSLFGLLASQASKGGILASGELITFVRLRFLCWLHRTSVQKASS